MPPVAMYACTSYLPIRSMRGPPSPEDAAAMKDLPGRFANALELYPCTAPDVNAAGDYTARHMHHFLKRKTQAQPKEAIMAAYPSQVDTRALAYTSLVLGAIGLALCWWLPLGLVIALAGLIVGIIGLIRG